MIALGIIALTIWAVALLFAYCLCAIVPRDE